jgi:hypothetical protein
VREAIDSRADDIDTSYDSRYGFPTDIWIDYDRGSPMKRKDTR